MQRAIDETNRRRETQLAYNKEHGITPRGIQKKVADVMQASGSESSNRRGKRGQQAAPEKMDILTPAQGVKAIKKLEKQMYECARNLEFEKAAEFRDQLELLRENVFKAADTH